MSKFASEDIEKEAEVVEDVHGHGGHSGHAGHGGHDSGHGGHGDGHGEACTEDHGHGGGGHGGGHGGSHSSGGHSHGDGHGHVAKKSRHDSRVNSFALVREGDIIPQKLGKFMQSLGTLPEEKGLIFRIKGILAIKNHPYKHVFHAVMDVSDEDDAGEWGDEKRISKIVFIGKGMDRKFITDQWDLIFDSQ
ncbi:unnamed protein product [Prorocentrum cordatum]|uniref:CobW C-terminal domain-containing protein n=1 Tax=Prorocentrum cordatum TaxID=2364126 RepID=A0ABN9TZI7_9DINO|nr:unnamed protein product [Polarella glacialis]